MLFAILKVRVVGCLGVVDAPSEVISGSLADVPLDTAVLPAEESGSTGVKLAVSNKSCWVKSEEVVQCPSSSDNSTRVSEPSTGRALTPVFVSYSP